MHRRKPYIDIGDEDYHRYYYGSLCHMGCTARKDTLASGLYGIWVTGDNYDYADTEALEQVLNCVRGLDGAMYTPESCRAVEKAIAEAEKLLLERPTAERQEEIEACIQKLSEAVKGLKTSTEPDRAKLGEELKKAKEEALKAQEELASLQKALEAELEKAKKDILSMQTELDRVKKAPVLRKGDTVEVQGVKYCVTDEAKKQMEACGPAGRNETELTVADSIQVKGTTYQVTFISANAFQNCKKLTALTVGKYVNEIGTQAFFKCKKLQSLVWKGTKAPKIGSRAFTGIRKNCKVTVPKKMAKKELQKLKKGMKSAGKKLVYKKK